MTTQVDPSDTERELRDALAARAREIRPADRLDAILAAAHEPEVSGFRGRWLAGVGVAAAAAVIAGTVWAARPETEGTLPVAPPSLTPSPTSPTSPTPSPTTSPSPSATASASTTRSPSSSTTTQPQTSSTGALAIYRVGTNGGATNRPGLVREFWSPSLGRTTESQKVTAAVAEALKRTELWRGVTVRDVTVTKSRISLSLSSPGASASSADSAQLGVSALVWTAQGAVGRGDVPVRITTVAGGQLLGHVGTGSSFTRSSTPQDDLCDIWIDSPSPGASVRASDPLVVRGQAVAWEANVEWELQSGASTVQDGFATASIGAPSRGTFTIDLGRLAPGTYTFRAFTTSAEDGARVIADRQVTFTVK
ncbi:Gmad2 immunoglobulin-like domain-containing protein [Knoellia sp. CPCC 206453]|uniref:Gmad2 immunoglobulin-like domain-containing protein n=1 Tax=Knoellia pratensis TaxID=3404796 RepID=UPI00360DB07D